MEQIPHKKRQIAFNRKLNAIASLAGGIAHEFNNALTALTGYNDLTKINYQDAQNVLKYAENSSPLLDRLTPLTQKLLSYSRSGKYKTETVSIRTLIDRCLHHFKNVLGIVANHHGAIFVDSVPERETIVTIYLPLE